MYLIPLFLFPIFGGLLISILPKMYSEKQTHISIKQEMKQLNVWSLNVNKKIKTLVEKQSNIFTRYWPEYRSFGPQLLFLVADNLAQRIGVFFGLLTFIYSIFLWVIIPTKNLIIEIPTFYLFFQLDKISCLFIILTNLLIFLCILLSLEQIKKYIIEYILCLFMIQFFLIGFFLSFDLITFYIMFEATLVPMYLIIGLWGTRERRIYAAYKFFIYTLIGSIVMLISILILKICIGSTNIIIISLYDWAYFWGQEPFIQILIWGGLFLGFAIKIPMVPVHLWLPEAHVEAPTGGSVLLAGVLLKLGGYGLFKISITLFPYAYKVYMIPIQIHGLIGLIFASIITLRQIDLKKLIAYTSIAHMNLIVIGLFSGHTLAILGSLILMIAHGIVSSALFICVGILYDRFHTRIIFYYSGIIMMMPLFAVFFFIFSISNFGFPGSGNFIGELLLFIGILENNFLIGLFISIGFILSAYYSIWVYNKMCGGSIEKHQFKLTFYDLTHIEFFVLFILVVFNFLIGLMFFSFT